MENFLQQVLDHLTLYSHLCTVDFISDLIQLFVFMVEQNKAPYMSCEGQRICFKRHIYKLLDIEKRCVFWKYHTI
jgi:hypothetical protein